MIPGRYHRIVNSLVNRRLSRRVALSGFGGGVAAGLATTVPKQSPALAQSATPAAEEASLSPGSAEILWDTWSVPHIFAADDESLFYASGWANAHNHANMVLAVYGNARDRAAEYWGEQDLASDQFMRTMGVPERSQRWYEAQPDAMRRSLDAFAAGFNDYAAVHPDAISAEMRPVLPVTGVDSLAVIETDAA